MDFILCDLVINYTAKMALFLVRMDIRKSTKTVKMGKLAGTASKLLWGELSLSLEVFVEIGGFVEAYGVGDFFDR